MPPPPTFPSPTSPQATIPTSPFPANRHHTLYWSVFQNVLQSRLSFSIALPTVLGGSTVKLLENYRVTLGKNFLKLLPVPARLLSGIE